MCIKTKSPASAIPPPIAAKILVKGNFPMIKIKKEIQKSKKAVEKLSLKIKMQITIIGNMIGQNPLFQELKESFFLTNKRDRYTIKPNFAKSDD